MKRFQRVALNVLIFFALFFGLRMWMRGDVADGKAPVLRGELLAGNSDAPELFDLKDAMESHAGAATLVHFWATWCGVCETQHGSIAELSRDRSVITIATQSGSALEVERYMRKHGLDFPVLVDTRGEIAKRFGVKGFPTSFIVDANQQIRFAEVGYTTQWGLLARLWWASE